jgi:hypothetical protein
MGYSSLGVTDNPPSLLLCLNGVYRHKFTIYIFYSIVRIGKNCLLHRGTALKQVHGLMLTPVNFSSASAIS